MTTFHNPENLTPDQYGAKEGWRLLTVEELNNRPSDSEFHSLIDISPRWCRSDLKSKYLDVNTYRTRTPLSAEPDVWIKRSFRAPDMSEFPVWYFGRPHVAREGMAWRATFPSPDASWTHWKKAEKAPEFPVEEVPTFREDQYWLNRLLEQYHAGEINPQQFINAVSGRVKE